jgi:hypothetical protein
VGLRVNSTIDIWLQRNIWILPKLSVLSAIVEPVENKLNVWFTSFNHWQTVADPSFTATIYLGNNQTTSTGTVSQKSLTGQYLVSFDVDYIGRVSEGMNVSIYYNISSDQGNNLTANMTYLSARMEILAQLTPLGQVIIHTVDPA